jgi:hypothetical protein
MIWWWRRPRKPDAWEPELGEGAWRTLYAECCDSLLAYDRVVDTLEDGALRDELTNRRADLPGLLDRARWLTEKGAALDPPGPVRDPRLLALLRDDPLGDQSTQLADRPPTILLAERVIELRDELWRAAEEAARLAVKTRENALATDVAGWLSALASGVASAREAGWISAAYREGDDE